MGTPALFDINIFEDVARARQGWESRPEQAHEQQQPSKPWPIFVWTK